MDVVELIKAVAGLGTLVLGVALILAICVFRDQIKKLLDRLSRVKVGDVELSAPLAEETETGPTLRHDDTAALQEAPSPEEEVGLPEIEPTTVAEWGKKMVSTIRIGDMQEAEEAFAKTQELEEDPVIKLRYKALYAFCRYGEGDTSALGELQQLTEQEDVAATAYQFLAQCYETAGDFKNAGDAYEVSAQHADSEQERADAVVQAAMCLFKDGKQQDAYTRVMHEISELSVPDALSALYEGLASLYEHAKERALRALALEKALEIKPNDIRLRFSAAYSYGDENLDPLALLHYKTLLRFAPDAAGSLNNIGVAYLRLDMPIRAIKSYQAAAAAAETLAAANLAQRFIRAGFKQEALHAIEEARQQEKVHPQVGAAMTEISEREEAEANTEALHLEAARDQQRFLLSFAEGYFTGVVEAATFAGTWTFPDGVEATISHTVNEIEANWVRDEKKHRFTGDFKNRGARITTQKMRYYLGKEVDFVEDQHGYAYLSPDGQQLFMMTIKGHEHSLETLTRYEGDF